jgi:hypothetical protein
MIPRRAPLTRSRKPIARSPIRHKKRERRESWRNPGRVREDAAGIAELRLTVFMRSFFRAGHKPGYHRCENKMESGKRCRSRITWTWFEMHHLGPACERSDVPEKVMACCAGCHADNHRGTWKASRWDA